MKFRFLDLNPETVFQSIILGVLAFILFYLMMKLMVLDEAIYLDLNSILSLSLK